MEPVRPPKRLLELSTNWLLRRFDARAIVNLARLSEPFECLAILWSKFRVTVAPPHDGLAICSYFFCASLLPRLHAISCDLVTIARDGT